MPKLQGFHKKHNKTATFQILDR